METRGCSAFLGALGMYALLIDIGNTSLKIGLASPEKLITAYTLPTDTSQSGDSLGLQIAYLRNHAGVCLKSEP